MVIEMNKNVFEIYLTSPYVRGEEWLRFIYKISKINGIFRYWNLWICFEKSYIKYYIETDRILPPIVGEIGQFLIKRTDISLRSKTSLSMPYVLTKNYKTLLDLYDRFDAKNSQKVKSVKITFFPYKCDNYLSTTHLYLEDDFGNVIDKKVFLNSEIYNFISLDFSTHIRFLYSKNEAKYLNPKKIINLLSSDKNNAILRADVFPYLQDELYLNYTNYDFATHSLVVGASGTGKTKLISSMIKNMSYNTQNKLNYKIVVIDPHDSIKEDIGGLEESCVIDFKTSDKSVNLFVNSTSDILATTESIISILKNIIADRYNSKLERVLRYSIHLLLENKEFSLVTLRKLLTEIEYRNKVIRDVEEFIAPNVVEFFRVDFSELKNKSYQEAISPIISFIDEMEMLPALNSTDEISTIEDKIRKNFVTILSLDQMSLGLNITKTIAGFAMQQLLQLVQSHSFYEHIILVVDEVAVIENPILNRFLAEARKYNLSLILASQYFDQISEELQKSIFTNVINYFIFRVSRMDAIKLERNIQMELAVNDTTAMRVKMFSELNNRECIVRIGSGGKMFSAFKGKTLDFIPVPYIEKDIVEKKFKENKNIEKKKSFSINTNSSLKDIMSKQSTSRKKVNFINEG